MTLTFSGPVRLIGDGALDLADIEEFSSVAPHVVAADGGALKALEIGIVPEAAVGDFDSLPLEALAALPEDGRYHVAEQDSTDFEKCLRIVSAPLILALGFTGARVDHELAVYNTLVRHPQSPCIVVGERDVIFHARREMALELAAGMRVSLFPLRPVTGRSEGLHWPIDGLELSPGGRIGTSNRVSASQKTVRLSIDGDGLLVILPREALDVAIAAVRREPAAS